MYTFKFQGLEHADAETPYYYGSLPAKPERGHILRFDKTGNRYVIFAIEGEGLSHISDQEDQNELAWAEISRGEKVPTIFLQKLHDDPEIKAIGRSFDYEEVKAYSQENREKRLSASGH
jgi:hypothetical protein